MRYKSRYFQVLELQVSLVAVPQDVTQRAPFACNEADMMFCQKSLEARKEKLPFTLGDGASICLSKVSLLYEVP